MAGRVHISARVTISDYQYQLMVKEGRRFERVLGRRPVFVGPDDKKLPEEEQARRFEQVRADAGDRPG